MHIIMMNISFKKSVVLVGSTTFIIFMLIVFYAHLGTTKLNKSNKSNNNKYIINDEVQHTKRHRRLQFDSMFETPQSQKTRRKKAREARGEGKENSGGGRGGRRINRPEALGKAVEEIILNMDRYNLWWTGPPESDTFKPSPWSAMHTESTNAIFTMAMKQGQSDYKSCSSPNDFILFLGTARKVFDGDIVIAVDASLVTIEIKAILIHYKAVVYEIPQDLCAKETRSIFCGSQDERVPASVFRYFFYEKWASAYNENVLLLLADFRDILFQSNPFEYRQSEWFPEFQLSGKNILFVCLSHVCLSV